MSNCLSVSQASVCMTYDKTSHPLHLGKFFDSSWTPYPGVRKQASDGRPLSVLGVACLTTLGKPGYDWCQTVSFGAPDLLRREPVKPVQGYHCAGLLVASHRLRTNTSCPFRVIGSHLISPALVAQAPPGRRHSLVKRFRESFHRIHFQPVSPLPPSNVTSSI